MITTTELNGILGNMTAAIAAEAIRYNNLDNAGGDGDFSVQQLMIFDHWILSEWQQNDDGTTTGFDNYITQAEFDALIGRVRLYAAYIP